MSSEGFGVVPAGWAASREAEELEFAGGILLTTGRGGKAAKPVGRAGEGAAAGVVAVVSVPATILPPAPTVDHALDDDVAGPDVLALSA